MMLTPHDTELALAAGAVVLPLSRDLIVTTGEDAASFLNGQLSQAILPMVKGESRRSFLLDPQGKIVAWLRVTRVGESDYWLDVDEGVGEAVIARLNRFKLRTRVEFELVSCAGYAFRGTDTQPRPEASGSQMAVDIGWPGLAGYDLIGPSVTQPAGELGDPSLVEALRIREGMPRMGQEIQRATIPAETGAVPLSADFTKGCYTGQELVARVNSRGNNTPRKVHRVLVEGLDSASALPLGAMVDLGGEEAGEITSVAMLSGSVVALASIKRSADVEAVATVRSASGPTPAVLLEYLDLA